jgi:hypothetical protein
VFQPATASAPVTLPAGTYDVALTKPGEPLGSALLEDRALTMAGGTNPTVVMHLSTVGRLSLRQRHQADRTGDGPSGGTAHRGRPAVDVRANGTPAFSGLTSPHEGMTDVAAAKLAADVVLAGTATVVPGPMTADLAAGMVTIVNAIDSARDSTLAVLTQTVGGPAGPPTGVPAGTGGMATTGVPAWWYTLFAALFLLPAGGGLTLVTRTRNATR